MISARIHAASARRSHESGSKVMLPPPRPLRTARTSFPVGSSSLSNALFGTRLCHVPPLVMDLSVTVGMQQHPIRHAVRASLRAPDDVMVMPACDLCDRLRTYWTDTV